MNWPRKRLGELGVVSTGSTPRTSEPQFYGGDIPFVTPAELDTASPVITTPRTLTTEGAAEARVLPEGTVMVCCIGSLGKTGIAGRSVATNQQINSVVFDSEQVWPRYGFYACRLLKPKLDCMAPATTLAIVSKSKFAELTIPVPPLPAQRRIAEVLDLAEALRAKRHAAIALLETLAQAIFVDMFGDPATNPKGWPISQVGDVADVQGGLQVTTARKSLPREAPYLRVANVYRGYLDLSEIKTIRATEAEIARTMLVKGDLLIVEGHGNPAEIGRGALWDGSISGCIHQNHLIRARFGSANIVPLYACEYLNSSGGRRHLLRAGKTTSGLNTISVSEVRGTPIAVPPIDLQHEFARRFAAIGIVRMAHRASLIQLDGLFASIQYRAFRGEL